ncbi:MAG: flavodoxin family protein [Weeksellaceae bacterium]
MNILIVFETYSNGTQTAVDVVSDVLKQHGHQVTMKKARETDPVEFQTPGTIILASPSWLVDGKDGQPHEFMKAFLQKATTVDLTGKYCAVFGLGDSTYARFTGAVDHLVEFVETHHGKLIVEPLRVDEFYFHQERNETLLKQWAETLHQALQK